MKRTRLAIGFMLFTLLGASYTTTAATNYFTEEFLGDYDLGGYTMTFQGVGGPDFYAVTNVSEITELPVAPVYGYTPNYYTFTDYYGIIISVPNGNSIKLYGNSYDEIALSSDGFMAFGTNSNDWAVHFDSPHISPYYADLNPAAGGTVSFGELNSGLGFVVTFEDVPRSGSTNVLCTFQCIMLYGAGGAIQMSWLHNSDPGDVLVGLSRGGGLPVDYTETDLSAFIPPPPGDVDLDGLPDWWEELYFTHYTNCAPDGHGDLDGYDNEREYIAGTDPKDSSSYFKVSSRMGASQITLNWNSLTGRVYSIQHTRSLTSPFTNLVDGVTPTPPVNSYAAPIGAGQDSGFFKASVEMAP